MVSGIAVIVVQPGERSSTLLKSVEHAASIFGLKGDSILLGADRARDLNIAAHKLIRLV